MFGVDVKGQSLVELRALPITRYVTFAHLLDLLENGLYVPSICSFGEPFEIGQALVDALIRAPVYRNGELVTDKIDERFAQSVAFGWLTEFASRYALASCWHAARVGSAALWRMYGRDSTSVAIETTAGELIDHCRASISEDELKCFAGLVVYNDSIPTVIAEFGAKDFPSVFPAHVLGHYPLAPFRKRPEYWFESEFRVLAYQVGALNRVISKYNLDKEPQGWQRAFADRALVSSGARIAGAKKILKRLIVAPSASTEHFELTKNLVRKYDVHAPVERSTLTPPVPMWDSGS